MEANPPITQEEERRKRRGMIISFLIHTGIIILALLPLLHYPDPPPGQEGVLISFGQPEVGQGDDRPDVQNEEPEPLPQPEEMMEEEMPVEEEVIEEVPVESEPEPAAPAEKVVTTDNAEVKIRQAEEAARKAELQRQAAEEAARKKAAEEAARQKRAAERAKKQAEYEAAKKQYGDFFGGQGKGDTGKKGNQGDPQGDPNSNVLEGVSKGSGIVGGGLRGRGVRRAPEIIDNSQKAGRVVISVCVDKLGNVMSADYTQRGSTTSDRRLVDLAKQNARRYLFSEGSQDEQCGTITYDFKLK